MSSLREQIENLEKAHCRAYVDRDYGLLERMWSDDLMVNSPINIVHDKKRVLELLRAGVISHVSLECSAETVKQQGSYVITMGSESVVNQAGGPVIKRRYTNVWNRSGESWVLVMRHANIIGGPLRSDDDDGSLRLTAAGC